MYKYIWYFNVLGAVFAFVMFLITWQWLYLTLFGLQWLILCITYKHVRNADKDNYVYCLRCKAQFLKQREDENFTCGYYDCSEGYWADLVFPKTLFDVNPVKDRILCDECMWNNENYIARYGEVKR